MKLDSFKSAIDLEMGSSCDKGICMHMYLAIYIKMHICTVCVCLCRHQVCMLYYAAILVFIREKDFVSFINICAHQISLHGFKMPKSYLSKVILPV